MGLEQIAPRVGRINRQEAKKVNSHVKSYLFFIGFMVLTKAVVVPMAKSANIPFVKDL